VSRLITPGLGPIVDVGAEGRMPGMEDTLVSERTIGGPLSGKDVRLYLDRATLAHLLEVAKSSVLNRAQLNGVGVRVRLWRTDTGHLYETWQLVAHSPRPESMG
jgi:hypothetical protein